jgi:hypothetical protein
MQQTTSICKVDARARARTHAHTRTHKTHTHTYWPHTHTHTHTHTQNHSTRQTQWEPPNREPPPPYAAAPPYASAPPPYDIEAGSCIYVGKPPAFVPSAPVYDGEFSILIKHFPSPNYTMRSHFAEGVLVLVSILKGRIMSELAGHYGIPVAKPAHHVEPAPAAPSSSDLMVPTAVIAPQRGENACYCSMAIRIALVT